jgi:hypothetical protein
MRKLVAFILLLTACSYLQCCHSSTNNTAQTSDSTSGKSSGANIIHNPEFRKTVRKDAVAEYKEKTDDRLNDWYFSVRLFETERTDDYLVKMEFEGIEGTDTLRLPDLGIPPKPVIKKGKDKYACIIGFMDNDDQFREYKMVYVTDKGRNLRITTLKHYSVTAGFKLESQ